MATEGLDEEMIKNGIQESSTTEIEQEYNSLINELGNDPNKANNARVLRLLYTSFRTASGNDKILRKMYKDLQKKYTDLIKINENLKITQENELKNYEAKSQKYNELLKANIAATEELKQKEKEFNEFTIATRKEEPEIDEGVLQELKITNEQLNNELFETKQRLQENLTKLNKIKDDYEKLTKFKEELVNDISFLFAKISISCFSPVFIVYRDENRAYSGKIIEFVKCCHELIRLFKDSSLINNGRLVVAGCFRLFRTAVVICYVNICFSTR